MVPSGPAAGARSALRIYRGAATVVVGVYDYCGAPLWSEHRFAGATVSGRVSSGSAAFTIRGSTYGDNYRFRITFNG